MSIDRAGFPFVLAFVVPAGLCAVAGWTILATAFGALALFMLWFFRSLVLAPADGRVVVAGRPEPGIAPPGEWQQVSIFLSPLDVHINRVPIAGRVTRVEYRPGRFLAAYRDEAARENERCEIWLEGAGVQVVARQVVGVLARRVVCRLEEGQVVGPGQRLGLMKFGSRMDVFVPPSAGLSVTRGTRVRAGETVLARLAPADPQAGRAQRP
ncbi:MAG: phosphatidylserine decarboxylase [Acidobacteria bacterium]|nr:phosphatidylserine decarboxylase [Acidobacteriota bacterium]